MPLTADRWMGGLGGLGGLAPTLRVEMSVTNQEYRAEEGHLNHPGHLIPGTPSPSSARKTQGIPPHRAHDLLAAQ
jgi:hypothetical protein